MSILIESQTATAASNAFAVESTAVIAVSSGIATGEDCKIESHSEIDGWTDTKKALTSDDPVLVLEGPCRYRLNKPVSVLAYGAELKRNIATDLI